MAKYEILSDNFVNGNELYLYIFADSAVTSAGVTGTGDVLAFASSVEVSTEASTLDASNKMSCTWNAVIPGNKSYTVNSTALYTRMAGAFSYDALMNKMLEATNVGWAVGRIKEGTGCSSETGTPTQTFELDTNAPYYCGHAAITSLSLSAGNNEIAQCSITLTGSGAIQIVNVS